MNLIDHLSIDISLHQNTELYIIFIPNTIHSHLVQVLSVERAEQPASVAGLHANMPAMLIKV